MLDRFVAGTVTVVVIDLLEFVDIQKQERDRFLFLDVAGQVIVQVIVHEAPIKQTRQFIPVQWIIVLFLSIGGTSGKLFQLAIKGNLLQHLFGLGDDLLCLHAIADLKRKQA